MAMAIIGIKIVLEFLMVNISIVLITSRPSSSPSLPFIKQSFKLRQVSESSAPQFILSYAFKHSSKAWSSLSSATTAYL